MSGSIDNTTIGATTPSTGAFTQVDVDNVQINGNTVSTTDTNGNLVLLPDGTGLTTVGSSSSANYFNRLRSSAGQWDSYNDGTDTFGFYNSAGSPEGSITANTGSLAVDTTNGDLYIKTTDSTNTGWSLVGGASSGRLVQIVSSNTTTNTTATTDIPIDSSIPQNTEGDEILTASITPKNSANKLLIMFNGKFFQSYPLNASIALFQDSNADAISATSLIGITPSTPARSDGTLVYTMEAGTTSSTTFKIRVGPNTSSGNLGVNSGDFGSSVNTRLVIMEVAS